MTRSIAYICKLASRVVGAVGLAFLIARYVAKQIDGMEYRMTAEFDALKRAVEEESTVIDGAIAMLNQFAESADDPQKLQALAREVGTKREQLASALLRNTRAATIEQSTPTPDASSTPGMTTGNNEGGRSGTPVTEPTDTPTDVTGDRQVGAAEPPVDMGGNFPPNTQNNS